jgi:hypothetical protein
MFPKNASTTMSTSCAESVRIWSSQSQTAEPQRLRLSSWWFGAAARSDCSRCAPEELTSESP